MRRNVEPDLSAWSELLDWMLPRSHALKVSEEDLALLRPTVAIKRFAASALAKGVRLVVVTPGRRRAIALTGPEPVEVPAVPVRLVDTVGAGDSFQAALLTWLAEHGCSSAQALGSNFTPRLREALRLAVAAVTCSRRGADLPRRSELAD